MNEYMSPTMEIINLKLTDVSVTSGSEDVKDDIDW